MTAGDSAADPILLGPAGVSGSATITLNYGYYHYIKFSSALVMRGYQFTSDVSLQYPQGFGGTGTTYLNSGTPIYAPNSGPLWVRFYGFYTGGQSATITWTSLDPPPPRPYTWDLATVVSSAASGSITYDDVTPSFRVRYYSWTPAKGSVYTFTMDESYGYVELYSGTDWATANYLAYGYYRSTGSTPLQWKTTGETYHLVVYPNGTPTPETLYTLSWSVVFTPPYTVANDDFDHPIAIDLSSAGSIMYDNTGAWQGDSTYHSDYERSIWFSYQTQPADGVSFGFVQGISFTLTPSSADPSKDVYVDLVDTYVGHASTTYWSSNYGKDQWLNADRDYRVMLYFPDGDLSVPDTRGTLSWVVRYPAANSTSDRAIDVTAAVVPPDQSAPPTSAPKVWFP